MRHYLTPSAAPGRPGLGLGQPGRLKLAVWKWAGGVLMSALDGRPGVTGPHMRPQLCSCQKTHLLSQMLALKSFVLGVPQIPRSWVRWGASLHVAHHNRLRSKMSQEGTMQRCEGTLQPARSCPVASCRRASPAGYEL